MKLREVLKVVDAQETSEGAGVLVKRSLGTSELDHVDPFLLLDEFRSDDADDYIAGFPDHPHRGFETVTYMLAGSMQHRDHRGNSGELLPGGVQWMTAGRGIVHSEMPRQREGLMWGFQLWVNLPARDKMCEPRYQDIAPSAVPEYTAPGGVLVRVVAGESGGARGAVQGIATDPLYLDVGLPAGARFVQPVPSAHNAIAYVFSGDASLGGESARPVGEGHLAVLGPGEAVAASAPKGDARLLLIAGRPLGEPVARYGPFVMNSREELVAAFRDYQAGTLAG